MANESYPSVRQCKLKLEDWAILMNLDKKCFRNIVYKMPLIENRRSKQTKKILLKHLLILYDQN